jgi:exosortase/archaeosortase family protein
VGAEETLPILAAVPLFLWLGAPWRLKEAQVPVRPQPLVAVALVAGMGLTFELTLLLAAAWTFALWNWVRDRIAGNPVDLRRLSILPLLAFPWVSLDLNPVGWWFRLSGAWVVDHVYSAIGFTVVREGTSLLVGGIPIEVAAACSGMNSLQGILLAGLVLTWIESGRSRFYWGIVASLPALAWVANTVRVCSVVAMAVGLGPETANGALHQIGGWTVVLVVCWGWSLTARWIAGAFPSRGGATQKQA